MKEMTKSLFQEMVESSFAKIERLERGYTLKRIEGLINELDALENDLSIMLSASGDERFISR